MKPSIALTCLLAAGAAGAGSIALPRSVSAQPASPIAGAWTLNKSLSEMPPELGFAAPWLESSSSGGSSGSSGSSGGGGRGRRGGYGGGGGRGGGGNFYTPRESYDDAQRQKMMTAEARNPPARLIIVDNASTVTFTNELGQSRTVHPDGKQESIDIEGVQFPVTARRDGDKLVVNYHIQQNRDVRFTYSRATGSPSLAVEVQFLEHGSGDKAMRVYNPGSATETAAPAAAAATPPATAPAKSPAAPDAAAPGAKATPAETFDARPGAELKGLKALGVLVEDLSSQAIACGLNHDALESAVSKRLTDGDRKSTRLNSSR